MQYITFAYPRRSVLIPKMDVHTPGMSWLKPGFRRRQPAVDRTAASGVFLK